MLFKHWRRQLVPDANGALQAGLPCELTLNRQSGTLD